MILVQLDASSFVHLPLYEQQILTTQFVRCVFMGYGLDKRISMIGPITCVLSSFECQFHSIPTNCSQENSIIGLGQNGNPVQTY